MKKSKFKKGDLIEVTNDYGRKDLAVYIETGTGRHRHGTATEHWAKILIANDPLPLKIWSSGTYYKKETKVISRGAE